MQGKLTAIQITKSLKIGDLSIKTKLLLFPFTKSAIVSMFFEQIEKFQCLKLSTTQGLSNGIFRTKLACVQKRVSKFVNFKVHKVQKPTLIDFSGHRSCISTYR